MKSLLYIGVMLLFSCGQSSREKTPAVEGFKLPVVHQSLGADTLAHFTPAFLTESFCRIGGKSFATDTLSFPLEEYIDTSVAKYLNRRHLDTPVSYDGFELHPDYVSSVYRGYKSHRKLFCYYPLYVVNQSTSAKLFPGKDSYAFGIQEALDSSGNWHPIEGKGFDFCGNGYWNLPVLPKEFLVILLPKYKGSFKTKIRVRLKVGDMVYVSKAFDGSINYQQFVIEKGSYFDHASRAERASAVQWQFYGAVPMGKTYSAETGHAVYASQPE